VTGTKRESQADEPHVRPNSKRLAMGIGPPSPRFAPRTAVTKSCLRYASRRTWDSA
jgi:hypothetical protein